MRLPAITLLLLACRAPSDPAPFLPHPGGTRPETGDTGSDPPPTVQALVPSPGPITTELALRATLDRAAAVAARCVADDDAQDVLLVEDSAPSTTHDLRISGLRPATSYTCQAVPTAPEGVGATTSWRTDAPPAELRPLSVSVDAALGMTGAWTLAPYAAQPDGPAWLVIWGPDGRVRWWRPLPDGVGKWVEARFDPTDRAIVWGGGMSREGRVREVDLWDGELWGFLPDDWADDVFHHDGKRIADGRMMTLEVTRNHAGDLAWDGFRLRVVDPATDQVDVDYDSQAAVDAGDLPLPEPGDEDPWHANWMDWNDTADGPEVVVSLCFAQAVMAIDPATSRTRWVLGAGRGWTVLDADGTPLSEDELPQCQHGAEITPDHHLWVYDNGRDRKQSRAELWALDPATKTARREWWWTEDGWYQGYLGDIDDLGNDRVLITVACDWQPAEILEVDRATGQVASRMTMDRGGYTYRSERYDGCAFFDSARACPALAARAAELAPLFDP